jgi:hypothetical protein
VDKRAVVRRFVVATPRDERALDELIDVQLVVGAMKIVGRTLGDDVALHLFVTTHAQSQRHHENCSTH